MDFEIDGIKYYICRGFKDGFKTANFVYLKDSDLSIIDIGLTLGISSFTIGEINRGKNSWCSQDINYPIRKSI